MGALWLSVWPDNRGHEGMSNQRIGEKGDRILKRFGRGFLVHATNIAREALGVKYMIAQYSAVFTHIITFVSNL